MADDPRPTTPPYDPPKGSDGEATITTDAGAPLSYRYECAWMVLRDQDDPAAEMFYTWESERERFADDAKDFFAEVLR